MRDSSHRVRRDVVALEERRRRASVMFQRGITQADIARALSVSRQSVSRWHRTWTTGGGEDLRRADRLGRRPRVHESELWRIEAVLCAGVRECGYGGSRWTLRRIAAAVEETTGIHYHQGHVWRILTGRMGWVFCARCGAPGGSPRPGPPNLGNRWYPPGTNASPVSGH